MNPIKTKIEDQGEQ